jgi:hypothetical protein
MLYHRVKKPVIPIAVLSYDESWNKDEFRMHFPDWEVLRFHYKTLHLKSQNWRSFSEMVNPVSAALLCKMDFALAERVYVKLAFINILAKLKLDTERETFLIGFFGR